MDGPLASHYISKAEQDLGVSFARVDADTIDNIISKDEEYSFEINKEQEDSLKPIFEEIVEKEKYTVQVESLSETENQF
jgi:molecular chaperone HtpG